MPHSMEKVEVTAFDAARLKAIESYALLEHQLAGLLLPLLGVKKEAYTIFFRITNTRSRYSIITALLRDLDDKEARKFWKSIEKALTKIDGIRNNIIHWLAIVDIGEVGGPNNRPQPPKKSLRPGHSFGPDVKLTIDDLQKFKADADDLTVIVTFFGQYLGGHIEPQIREAWKKVFVQPLTDETSKLLKQCLLRKAQEPAPRAP
jgi:hypothetical protein